MRIALLEIENFRGIKSLRWAPAPGVNCLVGPGDSTKTTVLDAIEWCLNPRPYLLADDCDFYDLDFKKAIRITVTLIDLPAEFKADNRYGLYLRGWNTREAKVEDESGDGLGDALSVTVTVDPSLETRWSIFNARIDADEKDPPTVRYKDAKLFATTRLGPFAERHLSWSRYSILTKIDEANGNFNEHLSAASRAARDAFRAGEKAIFKQVVERAETLSKKFSVPVRDKYNAELDVQSVNLTSGGVALHDGNLPLRRLGTGSSRLIVSALQYDAGPGHIALMDEIEHGLEPHRLARLLKHLKMPKDADVPVKSQVFLTTHSPVTIRELSAEDIFSVRSEGGTTIVRSVATTAKDLDTAQRHLRATPEAFLARRILVGEGRTEQGLARGLDAWWAAQGQVSFALQGVVAVDGMGKDHAPAMAEHLLDLGYVTAVLLDSDEAPDPALLKRVVEKGGSVIQWPGNCSTEERIFLDLPWKAVCEVVNYARECVGDDSVFALINNELVSAKLEKIPDLSLPPELDTEPFRRALGKAAKNKNGSWFKDITRGEGLAAIIGPYLKEIADKPLAKHLVELRSWIDA
jgi:putative ATP-dependent endonuclease of OLD family